MDKPVDGAMAHVSPVVQGLCDVCSKPLASHERGHGVPICPGIFAPSYRTRLTDQIAALVAENERLERVLAKRNRTATDRQYMIDALVQMLGPKGLQVWKAWRDQGVERLHTSWGPDAAALTGEERAQVHLDLNEAIKTAVPIDNIDGDMPQIDVRDLAARTALETRNG